MLPTVQNHQIVDYHGRFLFQNLNPLTVLVFVLYIIASLTSIGLLFDNTPYACILEVLRCMILVTAIQRIEFADLDESLLLTAEVFFVMSGLFWLLQSFKILQMSTKMKSRTD
jgi:alkylglycerol monooxygenase